MTDFHILRSWRAQVAVDLGTAFIRVATSHGEISIFALDAAPQPPLRKGVVADPQAVAEILRPCLEKARRWGILGPRVFVGAPTDMQESERDLLCAAMRAAGASEVEIIPEPRAAALGAAVDISSHYAQMIVDVGEGVTDCAILRTGGILVSSAARIGCADLREQLRQGFLASERINITSAEAARILMRVGVDGSDGVDEPVTINGSRSDVAAPVRVVVTQAAIWAMLEPVVGRMVATAADFLHSAPHDLGCEIIESGIVLTGGGSLVPGMGKRLAAATAIEVKTPPDALGVVLLGLRAMLGERGGGE